MQAIRGHGNIKSYYGRFNLREGLNPKCNHCETNEDLEHIISQCIDPQRIQARQLLTKRLRSIGKTYPLTDIDITDETLVSWINE